MEKEPINDAGGTIAQTPLKPGLMAIYTDEKSKALTKNRHLAAVNLLMGIVASTAAFLFPLLLKGGWNTAGFVMIYVELVHPIIICISIFLTVRTFANTNRYRLKNIAYPAIALAGTMLLLAPYIFPVPWLGAPIPWRFLFWFSK